VISAEHGKTHDDAKGEVTRGPRRWSSSRSARRTSLKGEITENVGTGVDSHSLRQPLGVVAGITPFNFPVNGAMWMFPVAIACGNCFILKPSERDPRSSLLIAEWLAEAGLRRASSTSFKVARRRSTRSSSHPDVQGGQLRRFDSDQRATIYQTATAMGKRVQAPAGARRTNGDLADVDLDMPASALMARLRSLASAAWRFRGGGAGDDKVADALIGVEPTKLTAF